MTFWGKEYKGQRSQSPGAGAGTGAGPGPRGQGWSAPEGALQPLAHSSPAYGRGPAGFCGQGVGSEGDAACEDYQPAKGRRWSADDGSGGASAAAGDYQSADGLYASQVPYGDNYCM